MITANHTNIPKKVKPRPLVIALKCSMVNYNVSICVHDISVSANEIKAIE